MTIGALIDFYLSVRQTGSLIGFDSLYEADLEALKQKIQAFYGDQEAWLALPEETELPEEIGKPALDLATRFRAWNESKDPKNEN